MSTALCFMIRHGLVIQWEYHSVKCYWLSDRLSSNVMCSQTSKRWSDKRTPCIAEMGCSRTHISMQS